MKKLREKLNDVIGNNYGSFKPLIVQCLLLYGIRFNYSEGQIIKQAKNLLSHLDYIFFEDYDEDSITQGTSYHGNLYKSGGGKISISNTNKNAERIDDLIYIILHEICHSKSYKRKYNFSKKKYKLFSNKEFAKVFIEITIMAKYGSMIMETYNELGSIMTLFGGRTIENWYYQKTWGYGWYTFFPSLMSSALGYTDYELVKEANISLSRYDKKVFSAFYAENKKQVNKIINRLQINMDWLAKLEYEGYPEEKKVKSTSIIKNKIANVFDSIYRDFLQLASIQVKDDSRPISEDYALELQIREMKMKQTIESACSFRWEDYELYYLLHANNILKNSIFFHQVRDISVLSQFKDTITGEDFERYSKLAKEGKLSNLKQELLDIYKINYDTECEEINQNTFELNEAHKSCTYLDKIATQDCQRGQINRIEFLSDYIREVIIKEQIEQDSLIEQKQKVLEQELERFFPGQIKDKKTKRKNKKDIITIFAEKLVKPAKAKQYIASRKYTPHNLPSIATLKKMYLKEFKEELICTAKILFKKETLDSNLEEEIYGQIIFDLDNQNRYFSYPTVSKKDIVKKAKVFYEIDTFFTQYLDAFFNAGILDREKAKPYREKYEQMKADIIYGLAGTYLLSKTKVKNKKQKEKDLKSLFFAKTIEEFEEILISYNIELPEYSPKIPQCLLEEIFTPKRKGFLDFFRRKPKMLPSADGQSSGNCKSAERKSYRQSYKVDLQSLPMKKNDGKKCKTGISEKDK